MYRQSRVGDFRRAQFLGFFFYFLFSTLYFFFFSFLHLLF